MEVLNYRVVYLANLRSDIGLRELTNNIYNLFSYHLGINIVPDDIFVHTNRGRDSWYAFVNCHEEHQAEYVLDQLKSWESRRQTRFNFTLICEVSQSLVSDYKKEKVHKKKKSKKKRNPLLNGGAGEVTEHFEEYYSNQSPSAHQEENHTSKNGKRLGPLRFTKKVEDSVHGIYLEGEQLGNETRNKEFKKGGGEYLKNVLKKHVSKYVCAFLNSGEEGTLYVGVNDFGCVEGIVCPQSLEDEVRLDIDEAIKAIRPSVFPSVYDVKFTPVFYKLGVPKEDHKVIEINVHGTGDIERLYHSPHGVFLRRDGSVQTLGVTEVQEWSLQKHQKDIQKHQKEIHRLEERLQRQEDMLEKDKKSKVCVVM